LTDENNEEQMNMRQICLEVGKIKGLLDAVYHDTQDIKQTQKKQGVKITQVNQGFQNHLHDHQENVRRTRMLFIAIGALASILGVIATIFISGAI